MTALDALDVPRFSGPALCAETDPDEFFPDKGSNPRAAKRVCGSCEVRAECLAYALEHGERFGIWGGLSERERRRLTRPTPPVTAAAPPPPAPVAEPTAAAAPRRIRPWTDDEARQAVALLAGYGMAPADMARELGVTVAAVRRHLRTTDVAA